MFHLAILYALHMVWHGLSFAISMFDYSTYMTTIILKDILLQVGDLKQGETVLVTAAAGGTGQFAVSLNLCLVDSY